MENINQLLNRDNWIKYLEFAFENGLTNGAIANDIVAYIKRVLDSTNNTEKEAHVGGNIPSIMGWNHRILAHKDGEGWYFKIHEVFYDNEGNPISYTANPVSIGAESIEGINWTLDKIKECVNKPILSVDNFPNEWSSKINKEIHDVSQYRELLIDCVKACIKDNDSVTVEQQVDTYLLSKGN